VDVSLAVIVFGEHLVLGEPHCLDLADVFGVDPRFLEQVGDPSEAFLDLVGAAGALRVDPVAERFGGDTAGGEFVAEFAEDAVGSVSAVTELADSFVEFFW